MKIRFLITVIGIIFSTLSCYSQNITKILSGDDLNKLEKSDSLVKYIDSPDNKIFHGFTGNLLIKKYKRSYRVACVGEWERNDVKYGDKAISIWDSTGRRILYKEFFGNGSDSYVCEYFYKVINGKYYVFENMTIYFENGNPAIIGHNYSRLAKNKFGLFSYSGKRRYGEWQYYDDRQNLIKVKKYKEIK